MVPIDSITTATTTSAINQIDAPNGDEELDNIFKNDALQVGKPDGQLSELFINVMTPLINGKVEINHKMNEMITALGAGKNVSPQQLLDVQNLSTKFSKDMTVVSKVISLGVKFVSEIIHLQ